MSSSVLIIGGGVIGLSIARALHKRGADKITLVEKGVCGEESSWAAVGMLGPQAEADGGGVFFDICCESRDLYPLLASELLEETAIDIELDRSGTLYLAFTDEDVAELHERLQWQRKAGLAVEHLPADAARQAEPFISPDIRGALFFAGDWQVDNRRLLGALKRYSELNGIEILENEKVERLIFEKNRVIGAEASSRSYFAEQTVLATGAWTSFIKLGVAEMPIKVEPIRGQVVAFQTAKRLFQRVIYSPRGYIVPRADGRILAGSTSERAGFDKTVTQSSALALRAMASEIAPSTAGLPTSDHWSGLRPYAADALPVIGTLAGIEGMFLATAHFRNGILLAPWTAKATAAALLNASGSAPSNPFGPERFRFRRFGAGL